MRAVALHTVQSRLSLSSMREQWLQALGLMMIIVSATEYFFFSEGFKDSYPFCLWKTLPTNLNVLQVILGEAIFTGKDFFLSVFHSLFTEEKSAWLREQVADIKKQGKKKEISEKQMIIFPLATLLPCDWLSEGKPTKMIWRGVFFQTHFESAKIT